MIDIHTELLFFVRNRIDKYTEWQMLRQLKELQDALDEVPDADPYECCKTCLRRLVEVDMEVFTVYFPNYKKREFYKIVDKGV